MSMHFKGRRKDTLEEEEEESSKLWQFSICYEPKPNEAIRCTPNCTEQEVLSSISLPQVIVCRRHECVLVGADGQTGVPHHPNICGRRSEGVSIHFDP